MEKLRSSRALLPSAAILALALAAGCSGRPDSSLRQSDRTAVPDDVPVPAGARNVDPRALAVSATRSDGLPAWVGAPGGWEKLNGIERWLRTDAPFADDFWVVEGRLQLAEGRMSLASEAGAGTSDREARTRAAEAGFEEVIAALSASEGQRERARRGLARLFGAPGRYAAGLPASVLPRSAWGARPPAPRRMDRAGRNWRYITVHHSAMDGAGSLSGNLEESRRAIRQIQRAHMSAEGYGDIGYHFVIDPAGRVFECRELTYQGAHAGGNNNVNNIGVCLLGNFESQRPTPAALAALDALTARLRASYGIPAARVKGHRDWKNTECPGRYLAAYVERYR